LTWSIRNQSFHHSNVLRGEKVTVVVYILIYLYVIKIKLFLKGNPIIQDALKIYVELTLVFF